MRWVNRRDGFPPATLAETAAAWWGEVCTAPGVFCWRQPFFWNAVPDHVPASAAMQGRRGVVLIHGFVCNRGFWTPWLRRLRHDDRAFVAVSLEPVFSDIDAYVPAIDDAVRRVTEATGLPPVLVCHSMGGIAARAWLRSTGDVTRVAHVITIGSPHRGTWLGRLSHVPNGRQMRQQNDWLNRLNATELDVGQAVGKSAPPAPNFYTCWYSNCDNIVFPASTSTLPGADNRLLRGVAHVQMAFDPRVIAHALRKIASL